MILEIFNKVHFSAQTWLAADESAIICFKVGNKYTCLICTFKSYKKTKGVILIGINPLTSCQFVLPFKSQH